MVRHRPPKRVQTPTGTAYVIVREIFLSPDSWIEFARALDVEGGGLPVATMIVTVLEARP